MKKLKIKLFHFKIKMQACFRIIFGHKHWFLISLDSENLMKLIAEDDFEAKLLYHGMVRYNVKRVCKNVVCDMDDVDWILEKAQFEADADEYIKRK